MSRFFNGGTAADLITCARGNASANQGSMSFAALVKPTSSGFTGWMARGMASSTPVWALLTDAGKLFVEGDFGSGAGAFTTDWWWFGFSRAAGVPRFHLKNYTLNTAWSHIDGTYNPGNGSGPITSILVGGNGNVGQTFRGSIAVEANWTSSLADAAFEAACTSAAADTLAASPSWMIRLNQASIATAVTDDTGGGGNQTAISGTSVVADPPGYNYTLGSPGPTVKVWNGSAEVAVGSVAVWNGSTELPASVASIV